MSYPRLGATVGLVVAVAVLIGGGLLFINSQADAQSDAPRRENRVRQVGKPPVTIEEYRPTVGKRGGRFVQATFGEPKSFNPITAAETSTTEYTTYIFESLIDLDPFTGESRGRLAESWSVAEDGLTWTFKLRPGLKFNDGTPLTPEDVVFTWNDLIYDLSRPEGTDPRWPSSSRDIATFDGKIAKVRAVDDLTVEFKTPVKLAIADQIFGGVGILSKKKYEPLAKAGTIGGAMGVSSKPEDLVGAGPFMLGEYKPNESVRLTRNPHYYMKDAEGNALPYLDDLLTIIVKDLNAMLLAFQQGVTDAYQLTSGKEVAQLKPHEKKQNFILYQLGPSMGTNYVVFNMNLDAAKAGAIPAYKVDWFRDVRFRQAVAYAIDRGALVRNVLELLGEPLAGPMTTGEGPFTNTDLKPYPHDPAKARALLDDMGLKDRNGDGIREDEQGRPVQFTINTNSGNNIREQMANFITTDLKNIGMDVNTLFLEFNTLVDKLDSTQDWECLVFSLTGGVEPHFGANVYKSSGRLHMWWPNQKTPGTDWERRIDEIFYLGVQELDKQKRRELYREWQQIMHEQQPMIYTVIPHRVIAVRNRFGNVFPTQLRGVMHNIEELYVLDGK